MPRASKTERSAGAIAGRKKPPDLPREVAWEARSFLPQLPNREP